MRSTASVEEKIRKGREGIIGGKTGAKAMQDNLRKTVLAVVSKGKAENFGVQLVMASCNQGLAMPSALLVASLRAVRYRT